jgi:hypothetical protein
MQKQFDKYVDEILQKINEEISLNFKEFVSINGITMIRGTLFNWEKQFFFVKKLF